VRSIISGPRDPQPRAFKADRRQLIEIEIEIDGNFAGRADIFPARAALMELMPA
jgi:hypothetical protein